MAATQHSDSKPVVMDNVSISQSYAPSMAESSRPLHPGQPSSQAQDATGPSSARDEGIGEYFHRRSLLERVLMHKPTWQGLPAPITIAASPYWLPRWVNKKIHEPKLTDEQRAEKHLEARREIDATIARGRARIEAENRLRAEQEGGV